MFVGVNDVSRSLVESELTHGRDYDGEDPLGWYVTEKLDGCRAFWDGNRLWTRQGNVIHAPAWFTRDLPRNTMLDGEIYAGRGQLQAARKATQFGGEHFTKQIRFMVFDCPGVIGDYAQRMAVAAHAVQGCRYASAIEFSTITDRREVFARLQAVQSDGGEGLMLRSPHVTHYETGRTGNLVKIKGAHPAFMILKFHRRGTARRAKAVTQKQRNNTQRITT